MNRQSQPSIPNRYAQAGKWTPQVAGSAKIVWAKLTDDELLQSQGQADKLTVLVQERYALPREIAGRRVLSFLQQFKLARN